MVFLAVLTLLLLSIVLIESLKSSALSISLHFKTHAEASLTHGDSGSEAEVFGGLPPLISRIVPAISVAFAVVFTSRLVLRSIGW